MCKKLIEKAYVVIKEFAFRAIVFSQTNPAINAYLLNLQKKSKQETLIKLIIQKTEANFTISESNS